MMHISTQKIIRKTFSQVARKSCRDALKLEGLRYGLKSLSPKALMGSEKTGIIFHTAPRMDRSSNLKLVQSSVVRDTVWPAARRSEGNHPASW